MRHVSTLSITVISRNTIDTTRLFAIVVSMSRSKDFDSFRSRAILLDVDPNLAWQRVHRLGWTEEEALSTPTSKPGAAIKPSSLRQRAIKSGIPYRTVLSRVKYGGWTEEQALTIPLGEHRSEGEKPFWGSAGPVSRSLSPS